MHILMHIHLRYNIGQISIGIGDLGLAYQAFKIGVSIDSNHAECYNNLGVWSSFPFVHSFTRLDQRP